MRPRTVTITVTAQYLGLTVTLDGQPSGATLTFPAVVGMIREIGTPSPQTIGNFTYTFRTWSDDGAQTHQVTIPASNTTFTARFRRNKT